MDSNSKHNILPYDVFHQKKVVPTSVNYNYNNNEKQSNNEKNGSPFTVFDNTSKEPIQYKSYDDSILSKIEQDMKRDGGLSYVLIIIF